MTSRGGACPPYIVAQFVGAALATLLQWALLGKQGDGGLTLPGSGISTVTAMVWELVLTTGLVSVILGSASGAQQVGPLAAITVGSYIVLAGLWGAPVSGASMNPAGATRTRAGPRRLEAWWDYLAGPLAGAALAVGIAYILHGSGGGRSGTRGTGRARRPAVTKRAGFPGQEPGPQRENR
ncbi:aquaporin [Amycolatopsis sp. FDAARGOS 1241]|uniref:aquaporin n=1 Tax=Amycolatopsis sp. FDAARGOS 1241 TaxID=2778070 RepID=UPI0019502989|nr:aquaporin [Amycolatopsis sp. FDAARGOS 1241]QRP48271.1 aquaporin [Amycolatopsis sp. FDAARGOS 1241]